MASTALQPWKERSMGSAGIRPEYALFDIWVARWRLWIVKTVPLSWIIKFVEWQSAWKRAMDKSWAR